MSCTINNMGGAGSAVPKLRDEVTVTANIYEQTTLYTATQDCYVKLTIVANTTDKASNKILLNGNNIECYVSTSGSSPRLSADPNSSAVISTIGITSGTLVGVPGIIFLLGAGDVLSLDVRSGTSSEGHTVTLKSAVYY